MSRKSTRALTAACAFLAAALLLAGCSGAKRERVRLALEKAGPVEPGSVVSWVDAHTPEEQEILDDPLGQWAYQAKASSFWVDENHHDYYVPEQATGPPDVPKFAADGRAWRPSDENAGLEWLELRYRTPVHATGVRVREAHQPGSVAMIQVLDSGGRWHAKWKGTESSGTDIRWLSLEFPATDYLVDGVRVTLDTTRVTHFKEIDAVQLVGAP